MASVAAARDRKLGSRATRAAAASRWSPSPDIDRGFVARSIHKKTPVLSNRRKSAPKECVAGSKGHTQFSHIRLNKICHEKNIFWTLSSGFWFHFTLKVADRRILSVVVDPVDLYTRESISHKPDLIFTNQPTFLQVMRVMSGCVVDWIEAVCV